MRFCCYVACILYSRRKTLVRFCKLVALLDSKDFYSPLVAATYCSGQMSTEQISDSYESLLDLMQFPVTITSVRVGLSSSSIHHYWYLLHQGRGLLFSSHLSEES